MTGARLGEGERFAGLGKGEPVVGLGGAPVRGMPYMLSDAERAERADLDRRKQQADLERETGLRFSLSELTPRGTHP